MQLTDRLFPANFNRSSDSDAGHILRFITMVTIYNFLSSVVHVLDQIFNPKHMDVCTKLLWSRPSRSKFQNITS